MTAELRAEGLTRTFEAASGDVHAVADVDLDLHAGELLVVRGASGAGKTTLLNMLGTLDRPTAGRLWVGDVEATALGEDELARLRRERFGFVFQSFGLIPVLTAAENVEVPLRIEGVDATERDRRVAEALAVVGLSAQAPQRPGELSGGQQQRVGIARAIVSDPRIVIADEPTGQLDSRTAATIMDLLVELAHAQGIAALVATHDPLLVARADRVIDLHGGRITGTLSHDEIPDADEIPHAAAVDVAAQVGSAPALSEALPTAPLTRAELRARRAHGD
jgi:putative ABC transport system ATP-binding protein